MKITSWNVNSIKTVKQYHPWCDYKKFNLILDALAADIICLQETKISRDKLEREYALPDGYDSFYSFCTTKKGYSGVATFVKTSSKIPTVAAYDGLLSTGYDIDGFTTDEILSFDSEGRFMITDHELFVLFNVYCPCETSEERLPYKMRFFQALELAVKHLHSTGRNVVIVGDINVCRAELDHCDPKKSIKEHNLTQFGDHPARKWFNDFIDTQMLDLYRHFYPDKPQMYTCWNTLVDARPANYGTRIDYVLASKPFLEYVETSDIHADIMGSDHCPVSAQFNLPYTFYKATTPPKLCTRFYQEFSSRQRTLDSFFIKKKKETKFSQSVTEKDKPVDQKAKEMDNTKKPNETPTKPITISDSSSDVDIDEEIKKIEEAVQKKEEARKQWSMISITKPQEIPSCYHGDACKEFTVNKTGLNKGKKFFLCSRPVGPGYEDNKKSAVNQYRCNFFQWKNAKRTAEQDISAPGKKSKT